MIDNGSNNTQQPCGEEQTPKRKRFDKKMLKAVVALSITVILIIASIITALFTTVESDPSGIQSGETLSNEDSSSLFLESSIDVLESGDTESEASEESEVSVELFPEIEAVLPENCQAAGIYELGSLHCIFSENATEKRSLASITKLITASVALEYMPKDMVITVGSELDLVKPDSSICGLKKGYVLTLEQLLYGLLMSSGNDAAYTVAVNVARYVSQTEMTDREAVEYFCTLMNNFSAKIGAENSSFANPEGWDDEYNYSTVADIALISQYVSGNELIAEISKTDHYTILLDSGEEMALSNSNFMLHPESQFYNSAVTGLKTGSTSGAGKCLTATVSLNGHEYIAVVMGCPDEQSRYGAMKELIGYIEEYETKKFT